MEDTENATENIAEVTGKGANDTEKGRNDTEKDTENDMDDTENNVAKYHLNDIEERIIEMIRGNSHITQKMLSDRSGYSRFHIARKISDLQNRGIIRRIGPDKGGEWIVV